MDITGAVALVTGAASGLGEATVRALAGAGAAVVLVDEMLVAVKLASRLGPLRAAVNCAGIGDGGRVLDRDGTPHDLGRFKRVIGVNLAGTFNVLRLAAAEMARLDPTQDGERGVVVNTASIAGFEGQVGQAAYAASKGGVIGLTLAAARDLGSRGIRVVTIAPGLFATDMVDLIPPPTRDSLTGNLAYPRRTGRPEEFADLVLAAVRNSYLNGETIRLDAGLRTTRR